MAHSGGVGARADARSSAATASTAERRPGRIVNAMREPLRSIPWPPSDSADPESLVTREWLVTNGLGGYASGTVPGVMTRRYHGLLIAALPAPLGRIVMLSHVAEQLHFAE